MNKLDLEITRRFAKILKEKLGSVDIILYGSRARGENTMDSDVDICVIVEKLDKETRNNVFNIAWEVSFEEEKVIVPLIFGRKEWEDSPILESPIYKNIQKEGIKV